MNPSTNVSFCENCSKINFEAQRTPSESDITDLLAGNTNGLRFPNSENKAPLEKISLGTLQRIRRDSSTCALCAIFCHIIDRQGGFYQSHRSLDHPNIVFRADPDSHYGNITTLNPDSSHGYRIRRLGLYGYEAENVDKYPLAYINHILQACPAGAIASTPSSGNEFVAGAKESRMLFGGRQRPLTVDLDLLKLWISTCEHEHGSGCSLTEAQIEYSQ